MIEALEAGDLAAARKALSMIVGRDTNNLDQAEISRAVIETLAESLCDGIVAPLWYLALGGVPIGLAYKAVNTMDSMIGHPEPPYTYFGRAAARLDDVLNFVPAQLSATGIVVCAPSGMRRSAWSIFLRDRWRHPSPNAGQSEAAMAGALKVRLGGMNFYSGEPSLKPLLGAEFRSPNAADARQALRIVRRTSWLAFGAAVAWSIWRRRSR